MAYKPYKMKGHTLPGINQKSEGNTDLPDGRSGSSPFQHNMWKVDNKTGKNVPKSHVHGKPRVGGKGPRILKPGTREYVEAKKGKEKGGGRSGSSPLQDYKKGYYGEGKSSPAKHPHPEHPHARPPRPRPPRPPRPGRVPDKGPKHEFKYDPKSPLKCPLIAAIPAIVGAVGALKKKKEEG